MDACMYTGVHCLMPRHLNTSYRCSFVMGRGFWPGFGRFGGVTPSSCSDYGDDGAGWLVSGPEQNTNPARNTRRQTERLWGCRAGNMRSILTWAWLRSLGFCGRPVSTPAASRKALYSAGLSRANSLRARSCSRGRVRQPKEGIRVGR